MTPNVLKDVFHIDAQIGKDPRTNKPMCITYDLIKGEENHGKKWILPFMLLSLLLISACSRLPQQKRKTIQRKKSPKHSHMSQRPDQSKCQRTRSVLMLSGFTGNVIELDVNLVGVDVWSKTNPTFEKELKDVAEVSEDNLEQIIELEPDCNYCIINGQKHK